MTGKRFTIKPSSIVNDGFVIIDKEKEYTFPVLESILNYMFCKSLNELHEENQRLKERNDGIASTNWEVKKILINYLTTNKYKSEKEVIKEIQKTVKLEMI